MSTSADLLEGCIAEGGLAADGNDASLLQLEHDGPAAQRVALGHSAHRAAAARQMLPSQRRVQAAQPTCRGQGLGLGLIFRSSSVPPSRCSLVNAMYRPHSPPAEGYYRVQGAG